MRALLLTLALLVGPAQADWTDDYSGSVYLEIGAGYNIDPFGCSICWQDNGSPEAHIKLSYEHPMNERTTLVVYYKHDSNWVTGFPFQPADESSHDSVGISMKFKLLE